MPSGEFRLACKPCLSFLDGFRWRLGKYYISLKPKFSNKHEKNGITMNL